MEIRFPRRGRAVVLAWLGLFWAALCALAAWQAPSWERLTGALGAAAGLLLWRRMKGVRLRWNAAGRLTLASGRLLPLETTLPPGAVLRVSVSSTPLLRLAGCRLVTLHTLHGQILLPGLDAADAAALRDAVCGS